MAEDEAPVTKLAVEVFPVAQDFDRQLRESLLPAANRVGAEVGRALSEQINASLSTIQIDVDTLRAHADLDDLTARLDELGARDTRHDIDVETAGAHAHIDELQARLDRLGATTTRHRVDVDTTGSAGAAAGLLGGFGFLETGLALLPAAIPVAASLIPLIEGIGAAAVGAGAGVGVLALAFHGIGAAVSALGKQSNQSGQQVAQLAAQQLASADAVINAEEAVRNAVQGAADARRSAALSVKNAEDSARQASESYTSAQYSEEQAQVSLTAARKQAAQTLQDLTNQVKDGALSQRQAVLDLQSAQNNLTVVDFNSHSTQAQRDEAQLAVDQAKQHMVELQQSNQRTAQQKAQADKDGVANAPTVLAAEHALHDATIARRDAQLNLAKSQAAVTEAERSGAEQIAKADQQVVQSQRALELAYAQAGAQGSTSANAVADAMAKLTPAGQAFALLINDKLRPAFKSLTDAAQEGFLPGFQAALTTLLPYLPGFANFIGDIAREMGNMAKSAATALTSPFWKQFFSFLGDLAESSLGHLGPILGNLATGFAGLFQALLPTAGGLGGGLEKITKSFADWSTHLGTNQGFQKFLEYVKENAPGVGRFFADFAVTVGKLVVAFAPLGGAIAVGLEKLFGFLSSLSPGQLIAIAAGIGAIGIALTIAGGPVEGFALGITALTLAVTAVAGGLVYAYEHFKWFHDVVDLIWEGLQIQANFLWHDVFEPFFKWIGDHWYIVATAFKTYWDDYLHPVLDGLGTAATYLWTKILVPTFDSIVSGWHDLATGWNTAYNGFIKPVWTAFGTAFTSVKKAFGTFRDGLSTIWTDIRKVFTDGYNFVTQSVLNKFIDAINGIGHTILGLPKIPDIGAITASSGGGSGVAAGAGGGNSERHAFALGGVVPGYAPGQDLVHAMVSPGEGILVPEAVRALGPGFVHSINKMFSNRVSTPGHFLGGGVVSGLLNKGADAALTGVESPIKSLINGLSPQLVKMLAQDGFGFVDKGIRSFIKTATGAGVSSISSGIADMAHGTLIKTALKLAGVADSAGNESDVNIIVTHESGWNPAAINLTDSNAVAGHPSQGLMQTIPSTFEAYRLASLPDNIIDPVANLVAGIRYAVARYGSLDDVPGVAAVHSGGNYVGYDNGGYLPPGISKVYNNTGKPEPVFTDIQWQRLTASGVGASKSGTTHQLAENLHLHGSRDEMLVEMDRRAAMQNLLSGP